MARKKQTVPSTEQSPEETAAEPAVEETPPLPAAAELPADSGPSDEERRAAAAAHGGILLNLVTGIGGPVLALILWLVYDRKSEYASWHALQALVFQGIAMLFTLLVGGIAAVLWLITLPLLRYLPVASFCMLPFTAGFTLLTLGAVIGSMIYGCAGALATLEGQDFRYRWLSDWIPPLSRP